jgi:hypothetical protein
MIVDVKCPHCGTQIKRSIDPEISHPLEVVHCVKCEQRFCYDISVQIDVTTYTLQRATYDSEPVEEPAPSSPVETPLQVEQESPAIEQSTPDEPEPEGESEQKTPEDEQPPQDDPAVGQWEQLPNSKNVTYLLKDDAVSLKYNGYGDETYGMDVIYTLVDMSDNERNIEIKDMLKDVRSKNSKISALKHFVAAVDSGEVIQ